MKQTKKNTPIKYHNTINTVSFKNFNSRELNIFFALCSIMRDQELESITISFKELKELLNEFPNNNVFEQTLKTMYDKLLHLDIVLETEDTYIKFVLFTEYQIKKGESITIKTNERFYRFLNELTKNFTIFELQEFTSLRSSYSKNLYRLLKQYKGTGKLILKTHDFRRLLDIPDSYEWSKINEKVLKKINEELPSIFPGFNIEKRKAGRIITHLVFTFYKEKPDIEDHKDTENNEINPICPNCHKELVKITSKDGTSTFYGHKNFISNECKMTFSSLSDIRLFEEASKPFKPKDTAEEQILAAQVRIFCSIHPRFKFLYALDGTVTITDSKYITEDNLGIPTPKSFTYKLDDQIINVLNKRLIEE